MFKKLEFSALSNKSPQKEIPNKQNQIGFENITKIPRESPFSIFSFKHRDQDHGNKHRESEFPQSNQEEDQSQYSHLKQDQTKDSLMNSVRGPESKRKLDQTDSMSTIIPDTSRWRVVARKARALGKMAVQNKKILSTKYGIVDCTAEKAEQTEKIKCLLPDNPYVVFWNRLINLITFYLLFIYVFRVCILPLAIDAYFLVEIIMQGCFLADTIISFFVAYYEQDEVITDLKSIMVHYMLTFFLLDLLASLPVNIFTLLMDLEIGDESHRILRLLPAFRIIKFMIRVAAFEGWEDIPFLSKMTPTIIRLMKILFLILYFIHFSACIFILLARIDNRNDTWLYLNDNQDLPALDLYIYAMYWSIQTVVTVGFGDVVLNTNAERLMALLLMYIGSAVYSFMISNLGAVAEEAATFETTLKAKINSFKKLTKETNLPNELVQKVKKFIESNHAHNPRTTMHEQSFITELPFTLKAQIMFNINAKVVENVPFLKDKDVDFILKMAPNLKPIELFQKETVFREGEYPEEVFFLSSGVLHLKSRNGIPLYVVSEGEMFGEIEVVQNIARISTAQAQSMCSLFSIEKERFNEILQAYPDIKISIFSDAQDKKKRLLDLKKKYKNNQSSGNYIVMGSHLRTNAMSADDYVNGMYEKSTDKFESQISAFLDRGVGKKQKKRYVQRLSKRLSSKGDPFGLDNKTLMYQRSNSLNNKSKRNKGGSISDNSKKEYNGGENEKSNQQVNESHVKSDSNLYSIKEDELINQKKIEFEKQYFQQAENLKDELKTAIETLKQYNIRMKDQEPNYDKVMKLIKAVEEKQQRINQKLELYKQRKLNYNRKSTNESVRIEAL